MSGSQESSRRLRQKERKVYTDLDVDDDELEGKRMFNLDDKLTIDFYDATFVKEIKGEELKLAYFQEFGFTHPLLVKEKSGLCLRIPSDNFQVSDVKMCVGSNRQLDVMDVVTQKGFIMPMKEWVEYYEMKKRDRLLNVISLEFSNTKLEHYVEQPAVIKQIDWVDTAWPQYHKDRQYEASNILDKMMYPKIQKYCLMSVKGCFTDFHIDMSGTSVWYHILRGSKVFWLIPPTEKNLELYERWVMSGKQGDIFFADTVDSCQRITLKKGNTFFIPTGWIHAVYTPEDSLVFGGNYLHSFNIPMQLRIAEVEDKTHVPQKFRFPFYGELHWYVMERYVSCLTGKNFRVKSEGEVKAELREAAIANSDTSDEKSNDGEGAWDGKSDTSDPKTPSLEEQNLNQPASTNSPRPQSPRAAKKPAQSSDDTSSSSSPSRSPRPATPGRIGRADPEPPGRKPGTLPGPSGAGRGRGVKGKVESDAERSMKSYIGNQSDLIRPVSVKLENCMFMSDKKGLMEGMTFKIERHYLTQWELKGLNVLMEWLDALPPSKKSIPKDIHDPSGLIAEMRRILAEHENDDPKLAVTGEQLLKWPSEKRVVKKKPKEVKVKQEKEIEEKSTKSTKARRMRCKRCEPCTRDDCGECHYCKDKRKFGGPGRLKQSCLMRQCMWPVLPANTECVICHRTTNTPPPEVDGDEEDYSLRLMECGICNDLMHQECLREQNPDIEHDGAINEDLPNSWECPKCCEAGKQGQIRPRVLRKGGWKREYRFSSVESGSSGSTQILSETEPDGRAGSPVKVESKPIVSGASPLSETSEESIFKRKSRGPGSPAKLTPPRGKRSRETSPDRDSPRKKVKSEDKMSKWRREEIMRKKNQTPGSSHGTNEDVEDKKPSRRGQRGHSPDSDGGSISSRDSRNKSIRDKNDSDAGSDDDTGSINVSRKRREIAEYTTNAPLKQCKILMKPIQKYVVRPAPLPPPPKHVMMDNGANHVLDQQIWMLVFRYLPHPDLCRCMRVCKTWNRWCIDRRLWYFINLNRKKIKKDHLIGMVRRQPKQLDLSWTNLSKRQLTWLMERLPQLKHLSLLGNSWASVCALCMSSCPLLHSLDLSWVVGIYDACIKDLVSPPNDHRPGVDDSVSRLHCTKSFMLCGSDITDAALEDITRYMTSLSKLNLSYCSYVTDAGIALLCAEDSLTRQNLTELDLTGCHRLTDACFNNLKDLVKLESLYLQSCPNISLGACRAFIEQHPTKRAFQMKEAHRIEINPQ